MKKVGVLEYNLFSLQYHLIYKLFWGDSFGNELKHIILPLSNSLVNYIKHKHKEFCHTPIFLNFTNQKYVF